MADEITPVPVQPTQTVTTKTEAVSTIEGPQQNDESHIGTISIRGILALILVLTICGLAIFSKVIPDVLSNITISVVSFYFGHQLGKALSK